MTQRHSEELSRALGLHVDDLPEALLHASVAIKRCRKRQGTVSIAVEA